MRSLTLILFGVVLAVLIAVVAAYFHKPVRDRMEAFLFDALNDNGYVSSRTQLEAILNGFVTLPRGELPEAYGRRTKYDSTAYEDAQPSGECYLIRKKDVYRRITGNIRINALVCRDGRYRRSSWFSPDTLYWCINKKILFKVLDLQNELEAQGYRRDGFYIKSGHRHPAHNERVGGASRSTHMRGEAVDLVIGDINNDGRYSPEDKEIVLGICESSIIADSGGIGRYPGTRTVHIDVRGRRARW